MNEKCSNSRAGGGSMIVPLAMAGYDQSVHVWNSVNAEYLQQLAFTESQVNCLAFSPDSCIIAAGGHKKLRFYDVAVATELVSHASTFEFAASINVVGFNSTGKWLYAAGEDGQAKIYDVREYATGGGGSAGGGGGAPGGTHSQRTRKCSLYLYLQDHAPINAAQPNPANELELVLANDLGEIHVWDIRNKKTQMLKGFKEAIQSLAIDHVGHNMATLSCTGTLYTWNVGSSGSIADSIPNMKSQLHSNYGLRVRYSPDSTKLASCGPDHICVAQESNLTTADQTLLVPPEFQPFDAPPTTSLTTLAEPPVATNWTWDCVFTLDSDYLISSHSDGCGRLWDLARKEVVRTYEIPQFREGPPQNLLDFYPQQQHQQQQHQQHQQQHQQQQHMMTQQYAGRAQKQAGLQLYKDKSQQQQPPQQQQQQLLAMASRENTFRSLTCIAFNDLSRLGPAHSPFFSLPPN